MASELEVNRETPDKSPGNHPAREAHLADAIADGDKG
jgi:hypothetical protein